MSSEKLNNLAVLAKNGCVTSTEEIRRHYLPTINRIVYRKWYCINDEGAFTEKCIKRLDDAIEKYDPTLGSSFDYQVKLRLRSYESSYSLRGSKRRDRLLSLEFLQEQDGETLGFQPIDVLADVESLVIRNEKVSSLARGDRRRKMVLNAWSDGCENCSAIARMLHNRLGGSFKTHLNFIQRFKTECQERLHSEAV